MPVSVVVGGQYGSEGKGKVALDRVRRDPLIQAVVRPGGTNSGHTGYALDGTRVVLRQLPVAALDGQVDVVFPPGSYIDVTLLFNELDRTRIPWSRVHIDARAQIIRHEHIEWERRAGLATSIGSTGSGTGAAVLSRVSRYSAQHPVGVSAGEVDALQPFLKDSNEVLQSLMSGHGRVLIEGTQGFGLSLLHGDAWPKATSRDTTAAGFLSEAGLSPFDVDQIILVIRCHPIRVAGDSGPLPNETSWSAIAQASGILGELSEFTSVTQKLRRVGSFDAEVVKKAIRCNRPTEIVLNHVDYVDARVRGSDNLSNKAEDFVRKTELLIGQAVDWIGTDEKSLYPRQGSKSAAPELREQESAES